MSELNIYQRVNAVMKEVEYIQKDTNVTGAGGGYKAVSHDALIAHIRKHLIEKGIVIYPEQLTSSMLILRDLSKDIKMHLYSGDYAIHFVNMDNPEDRITVSINAQAGDNGDKAPGKAVTYATKAAILKVFLFETGDMEESRTYEPPVFTDQQCSQFRELLEAGNGLEFLCFVQMVGPDIMEALNSSFPAGKITEGKKNVRELERAGWDGIEDYAKSISELITKKDPALGQLVDEMNNIERYLVGKKLTQTEIEYLKSFK